MRSKHPLYFTFQDMHQRCENPRATAYDRYGGRGIAVCERWAVFENFVLDMGPKPTPLHTLDRRDNDKGYSPDNCKWSTRKEQARNVARSLIAVIDGVPYKASELADIAGLTTKAIVARAAKGLSYDKVVSPRKRERPDNLEQMRERAWAKRRAQTHCKHGHEFTPENTYLLDGRRYCRACMSRRGAEWRAKRVES